MAYSKDFKECAVRYKLDNHTYEEVYAIFKIAKSTLYEWEKEYAAGFPDKPKRTCEKKIDKKALKKALEDKPDSELAELAEPFNCSVQAIFYALERMKITRKKRHLHIQKSPKKSEKSILK